MPKLSNRISLLLIITIMSAFQMANAQSPDSRNCNCFAGPVSEDFMLGSKVFYGSVGVVLRRNDLLKPSESQQVKFVIPRLTAKQGCGSVYSIFITDEGGTKVHESEDSFNELSYSFGDCSKTYSVTLMAYSKSSAGKDGNCSRRISFKVKPQCNTVVCNCNESSGQSSNRADIKFDGKIICLTPSATQRRYTIQYKVANKTNCKLQFETLRVVGGTEINLIASDPVLGRSTSANYNMGFTTPLSATVPTGSIVTVTFNYLLNTKACTAVMKIPYEPCR